MKKGKESILPVLYHHRKSALPGDLIVISLRIAILFFLPIPVLRTAAANHWVHRGQNSLLNNLFSSLFRVRFRPVEASGWIRSLLVACFCSNPPKK